ncbi:endonuclease/exonuclease/phosphatase family protein [Kibdelosporangium aridum]|uniref:Endonuclease/exonuclease/phosphatase family protein n=1 Tax=Kibdelosporangium aridum TaxID=2030 RepID=A0A428ZKS7_KIBAR|nr:endonuclease/exonuclease/phosphatase family protein [Kibdelosporangium aridum]RSM88697.1 endonuclease/exonuclease/phosphatase family protein [Kibdelosporangium aridum]
MSSDSRVPAALREHQRVADLKRVIIVLTTLALLIPPSSAATSTGTTLTLLQLNICHGGMAGCYRGDAVIAKAAEVIRASKPQVLSVNEACSGDIDRLRPAMGPARALFVAARNLDGTPVLCRGSDGEYGNIIMVAANFAGSTEESGVYAAQYTAADGYRELRSWACLPASQLTACTTHLSADHAPTALAQCQDLLRRAVRYPRPTFVAGDFNLPEHGSPSMRDCDPGGFSRRGDGNVQHVYVSNDQSFVETTEIDMLGTTDHPGWLVTVTRP